MPAEQLALLKSDGARASGPSRRPEPLRSCRWPGSRSTCRWPTSTGRSTTSCPRRCTTQAVPGCGSRCGSPGGTSTASCSARSTTTDHVGALAPLRRVVSPEPVLAPEVLPLARRSPTGTPARWPTCSAWRSRRGTPGSRPRSRRPAETVLDRPLDTLTEPWSADVGGRGASSTRLSAGESPRAVWTRRPVPTGRFSSPPRRPPTLGVRPRQPASACPTRATSRRVDAALDGPARARRASSSLTADLGPAARYRAFLAVARGARPDGASAPGRRRSRRCATSAWSRSGTTATTCYAEPRAPYPHAREVLLLRAHSRAAACCSRALRAVGRGAGPGRVRLGREPRRADRDVVRARGPAGARRPASPSASGERDAGAPAARMPRRVFEIVRDGARAHGPVLVHAPRYGYQPALACEPAARRRAARACAGPLGPTARRSRSRAAAGARRSPSPGRARTARVDRLRAPVVGSLRTAEEWGRSFPRTRWRRPAATTCSTRYPTADAGDRDRHPGRRAGRRGRLRRRRAARHLAVAQPRPTCAPARRRCAAGSPSPPWSAPGDDGAGSSPWASPSEPRLPGAGAVGSRAVRRAASSPSARRPTSPRRPGRDRHRPARGAHRGARGAASSRGYAEVLGPVDVGRRAWPGSCCGRPATLARLCPRRCSSCRPARSRPASCRPCASRSTRPTWSDARVDDPARSVASIALAPTPCPGTQELPRVRP